MLDSFGAVSAIAGNLPVMPVDCEFRADSDSAGNLPVMPECEGCPAWRGIIGWRGIGIAVGASGKLGAAGSSDGTDSVGAAAASGMPPGFCPSQPIRGNH